MTYDERMKMNELSVKAFGGAQKWNKIYQRGYKTDMIEKLEDGTERKYKGYKYQTREEIYNVMLEMIALKEKEAAEKKAQEEVKNEVETKSQD